ncbi:substrate-binding domain-containing protein [Actinoallomurus rhizosphaericola]|uniref:substrate-binding domain-containing protein n=1 Tax=Actinoallomurus rhizosphaericola TaxID=2952536 RepID=UPI002093554F|nr:substrate-binding domain-containing protein [Actinoallomurus rhizosphaericola]MCO5997370.1 substrate-binding domain-containing protein [Actinoallomurus rhizosphaericola]
MNGVRDRVHRWTVILLAAFLLTGGCGRARIASAPDARSNTTGGSGCSQILGEAKKAVARAETAGGAWDGPTSGPRAVRGKSVILIAEAMTNPGVAGVARSVQTAGRSIGWSIRIIDGQGSPAGIKTAFGEAITLRPSGIVVAGFDPGSVAQEVRRANEAGIPIIGWHAVADPGPSTTPRLFTNITTRIEDVAAISARWIIATSNGKAGVVVFGDSSVPFADRKAKLIKTELARCPGVTVLADENIPIPDAGTRTPQEVSALLARLGARWTHSVAINDLYFADGAPALRAAGRSGDGPPYAVGAGDGDPSAFVRIRARRDQAATVPEPLGQQGAQIIDEFNRAFAGRPPSGYVAPVHLTTVHNVDDTTAWDPKGYREAYRRIWGI